MNFVKYTKCRSWLLALATTCCVAMPGWTEKWHVFDRRSGLTSESVYAITETLDGKLWSGTLAGLFYFDGDIWQEESIGGNFGLHITKVRASSDGALWVEVADPDRSFDGWSRAYTLARLQDGEWDWIPAAFEDKTYRVIDFAESTNGDMWITYDEWSPTTVGSNGKIAVYRNGALQQIDTNELIDIEGLWFFGIIPRNAGGVWIYAKMPGKSSNMVEGPIDWLLSFDGANWSNTPLQDVMPWITTRIPGEYSDFAFISGGYELTDGAFLFEIQKEELFSRMDGLVYHDPKRNLWQRMVSSVVKGHNGQVFAGLDVYQPDPSIVSTILQDYAYIGPNEFWFATDSYVAHVVGNDTTRFNSTGHYMSHGVTNRIISGLAANNCGLLMATTDGSIWVGHKSEGTLSRYRNGTWRTYGTEDGLTGAQLTTFYETHDGSFVVGTTEGLVMLVSSLEVQMVSSIGSPIELIGEDAEGQVWSYDERTVYKSTASGTYKSLGNLTILDGLITSRGDIWIISARALYRWIGDMNFNQRWRIYFRNELDIQSIYTWSETEEGEFLVAGANANEIRIYNTVEDKFTPWADAPGEISSNSIHSMTRDNSGNRYFATDEGLALFSEGAWTSFTTEDGLADNAIVDVLVDDEGNLWCATTMGVSRYDGNSWQTFRGDGDLVNPNATRIAAGPDGDL
ncbi:MAG: hypothetical protein QF435_14700, partial [Arenicellales bacterium]|nr:hypothetical protein [Arenicellales bacterium]